MATRRIKEITNTATTFASDDFIALDGTTQGTRKMDKDDLIAEVSAGVSGDYLEEANNLSDVASVDTSKLNLEVPDVGTAPNEVPLNGQLGSMAYQSSDSVAMGTVSISDKVDGSLGVGVAPAGKLEVAVAPTPSSTTVNETADFADSAIISNSGSSANGDRIPLVFNVGIAGTNGISAAIVAEREASGWNSALSFWTNGVTSGAEGTDAIQEAMRIDSSGNVGIGTSAIPNKLTVEPADNDGILIDSNNDSRTGYLYFGDASSKTAGAVSYDHFSDSLRFNTAGSQRAAITSSGELQVTGNGVIKNQESGGNYTYLQQTGSDSRLFVQYSQPLLFGTAATERLRIDSLGALDVKSVGGASAAQFPSAASVNGITALPSATGTPFLVGRDTGSLRSAHFAGHLKFDSGYGIDFGSTSDGSGTMSSELLDDYEEGTWSPAFAMTGGDFTTAPTMDIVAARYVKVGHMVTFYAYLRTDSVDITGAGGSLTVEGLPYANAGSNNYAAINVGQANFWTNAPSGGYVYSGGDYIALTKRNTGITGSMTEMQAADLTAGVTANQNQLMISGSYFSF